MNVRKKKYKSFNFFIIFIVIFSISIGYAILNKSLNITGNSEVVNNTWDVYFENIKITKGSVVAEKDPVINNDKLSIDFNFMLNLPGDFYEFTVDVKNSGTIDAMIDSISKTPELTESQKKYMNYVIEYQNGEDIASKQLLACGEFVRLKVRVEFRDDVLEADIPTSNLMFDLGFTLNYIQADNTAIKVSENGINKVAFSNGDINEIGTIVTIGTEKFYTIGIDGDNVKLLAMYNLNVGNNVDASFNVTAISNPTGKQDSNMKGFIENQNTRKGTTSFSNSSTSYSGSIVQGYVNNYKSIIENMGIEIVEARLITKDELSNSSTFACSTNDNSCSSKYSWIYSTTYWTQSVGSATHVFALYSNGKIVYSDYTYNHVSGVRPVIVLPKSEVYQYVVKPEANGSLDDIGTIVTVGTEKFYTIGTEGNNVKLFSMYNLSVGNQVQVNGWKITPLQNATGMQDSSMRGTVSNEDFRYGTIAYSSVSSDYNGSIVEVHVNNYKTKLEKNFGLKIVEARLITRDELAQEKIGCSIANESCSNAVSWAYYSSYWVGTANGSDRVWFVYNSGVFTNHSYDIDYVNGVRPVIVIPKSQF